MTSLLKKLAWGSDPDARNAVTGLSNKDIDNVNRSWRVIYADPQKYGYEMFLELFRRYPATKEFFHVIQGFDDEGIIRSPVFRAHVIRFTFYINAAVTNLHQPEVVMAIMTRLGDKHREKQVKKEHFDMTEEVFLDFLKKQVNVKEDVISSWRRFISFMYAHVLDDCECD